MIFTVLMLTAAVSHPLVAFNVEQIRPATAGENLSFYISNHDQSPSHRVIHPIVGKTNFVYDAKGALEKVRGEAIAFYVRDSENVTIRNLRLDWERPCMTEATIVDIAKGETIVEIDRTRYPVAFQDGRLMMTGPGWTNETKYCKLFDGHTREQTALAGDTVFNGTARELDDGRIALKYDFSRCGVGGKIGDVIAFRPARRDFPAIVVYGSKNVVLEDVVVHDAKGMALIAQRSENVTWRGTKKAADKTAAVLFLLGEEVARRPQSLLAFRGLDPDDLFPPEDTASPSMPSLPLESVDADPTALVRRLGPVPLWRGVNRCEEALARMVTRQHPVAAAANGESIDIRRP